MAASVGQLVSECLWWAHLKGEPSTTHRLSVATRLVFGWDAGSLQTSITIALIGSHFVTFLFIACYNCFYLFEIIEHQIPIQGCFQSVFASRTLFAFQMKIYLGINLVLFDLDCTSSLFFSCSNRLLTTWQVETGVVHLIRVMFMFLLHAVWGTRASLLH